MRELIEERQDLSEAQIVPGSVGHFIFILASKLTQADMRQEKSDIKRGISPNIYRLGLFLKAKDEAAKSVKGKEASTDPKDLLKFKAAVGRAFTQGSAPANYVMKGIDKVLAGGKPPKISGKAGTSPAWK